MPTDLQTGRLANAEHELFAVEYVATGNASEAYRRVFPKSRAWQARTVHRRASEMLAMSDVRGRTRALMDQAADAAVATRVEVEQVLTRVIRGCVTDVIREDGSVDLRKLRRARQEVGEVSVEDTPLGRRVKVKFRDSVSAAERLAKMRGWDRPQQVELSGCVGAADRQTLTEVFRAMDPAERAAWLAAHLPGLPSVEPAALLPQDATAEPASELGEQP